MLNRHKNLNGLDIHSPISFVYANENERTSAGGFIESDINKLAKQESDNSVWMLVNNAPTTWIEVGFKNIPRAYNNQAATWTLANAGKFAGKTTATAITMTIPANSSVPFPIGTALTFTNTASSGNMTIAITTDTMYLAGEGTTGTRTLEPWGVATAIKVDTTVWMISGTGII